MSLSDKRFQTEAEFFKDMGKILYDEQDVKQFIKELKEDFKTKAELHLEIYKIQKKEPKEKLSMVKLSELNKAIITFFRNLNEIIDERAGEGLL